MTSDSQAVSTTSLVYLAAGDAAPSGGPPTVEPGKQLGVPAMGGMSSMSSRRSQFSAAHAAHAASQFSLRGSRSVGTARARASGARPARDICIAQ
jgi:hypothetical protein